MVAPARRRSDDEVPLLARPEPQAAEMARQLLLGHGIPARVGPPDAHAGLVGYGLEGWLARGDLFVPRASAARAREILDEAWDASALDAGSRSRRSRSPHGRAGPRFSGAAPGRRSSSPSSSPCSSCCSPATIFDPEDGNAARERAAGEPRETMGRPRDDFDLLLKAPHPVEAEIARGMLAEAGIPTLVHGADFDLAELGAAHALFRRADVYVPRGERSRARAVLAEAGYAEPLAVEPGEDVERAGTRGWQRWTLLLVWLGIPLIGALLLHLFDL